MVFNVHRNHNVFLGTGRRDGGGGGGGGERGGGGGYVAEVKSVNMAFNVHRNHKGFLGTGRGRGWGGVGAGTEVREERDYIYLSLHCHHRNDFCIKVGSDERPF